MKSIIDRIFSARTLALLLALCATTSAWAAAPVPVVVWDGAAGAEYNFSNRSKTVGGVTYYINNIGEGTDNTAANIRATDNSYLQVVDSNNGYAAPTITATGGNSAFGNATDGATVMILASGMPLTKDSNRALLLLMDNTGNYGKPASGHSRFGIARAKGGSGGNTYGGAAAGGFVLNGAIDTINAPVNVAAYTNGTQSIALTYKSSSGLKYYVNGSQKGEYNPNADFTPTGVCIGGVDYTNSSWFYAQNSMKIHAIAIFDHELTQEEIAAFFWPSAEKYQKWAYANKTYTWDSSKDSSDIGSSNNGTLYQFYINSGEDTPLFYSSGGDNWKQFCIGQTQYSAPGCALRFTSSSAGKTFTGGFDPFTFGGIIVESDAGGLSIGTTSDGRKTVFGAASGVTETWFRFDADASVIRSGAFRFSGNVNLDIASGKTLTLTDAGSPAIVASVTSAQMTTTAGGELIMHGLGNISVSELTASGAKLDYSNLTASRMATPGTDSYIQGNLVIDGNTSFAFPAGMAKNTKYALCSGTLTNSGDSSRTATISVGDDTFDAILTFDTSDSTVSYVPIYGAVVNGDTAFEDLEWTPAFDAEIGSSKFIISGEGKVTGLATAPVSIEIDSGVTLDVTAIAGGSTTFSGSGTLLYTSSYPDTVPVGYTYEYVGSDTEASPTVKSGVTVNGALKTSGYLSLTTFSLPSGGSLDVLDGSTRVAGASRALKGDVTVRDAATLVYASNDLLDYAGSTRADIYGTLEIDGSGTRLLNESSSMSLNFYGGSTIKGTGYLNIANNQGFNVKENPANDAENHEVQFQGRLKYNRKAGSGSIISVDDGATLVFSGEVWVHNTDDPGYIRKCGLGKMKFASGVTTSSFLAYINVEEGTLDLDLAGLTFGTGAGQINVADNAILQVTGASTTPFLLAFSDGATLKIDGSASLTVSQAVTLPAGENERVTLDLRDATLPTGTASSILLTASAALDLDVGRFEFEGASSDYYLSQNTTTGAVSIRLHAAKGSDGVYRDNLMNAFGEIVADHDLVITVLDGTGASNATLVKSANIAWDTENNQFLYGYAKIGNEPYISLTAAIEASTIGDTITLLRNTTEEVAIKNGTILALGGFTVGSVSAESGYVLVPDDAENPTSYSTVEAKVSAEIGGNIRYFESLADALAAADGAGTITLIADCSENASLAAGVTLVLGGHSYTGELSGSGTVVLSNLPTLNLASPWTGTVWLKNQSGIQIIPANYGNANSVIRFTGITGWIANETTCSPAFEFEDDGDTKALTMYYTSAPSTTLTFSEFRGTGTFVTAGNDNGYTRTNFKVLKWSDFTGSLDIDRGRVIFGEDRISTDDWRYIYVSTNETATVASGKIWKAYDGFRVNGTLNCNGGKIYGTGASETLKLGGSGSIVNTFEGGSAQCFNAGAITVSGSLEVKMVGGWSNFGTWTLTNTASLGFDPGTDDEICLNSTITAAPKETTINIYGNGNNVVVEDIAGVTKNAAIHIHKGGTFQVATTANTNDYLGYSGKDDYGNVTVDKGGELKLYSRETYTRNTVLNGGTINLAGVQSSRSIDIHGGQTISVTDDSTIKTTATGDHWIFLRNSDPTFDIAEGKTLTVNAGFNYGGTNGNRDLIKTGSGTMIVNGHDDGSGSHQLFTQCKGVDIRAGTYELNAVQNKPGTGNDAYTVASGAKLKIGANGQANMTTLNLVDGSLLEFGAGDETLINANTVTFTSGIASVSFSSGVTPTADTTLINWDLMPDGAFALADSALAADWRLVKDDEGLKIVEIEKIKVDDVEVGYINGDSAAVITNTTSSVTIPADATAVAVSFSTGDELTLTSTAAIALSGESKNTTIYATDASGAKTSTDITSAFKVTAGENHTYTVELDETKVTPEVTGSTPMAFTSTAPTFAIEAVPGLWYAVEVADTIAGLDNPSYGTPVQAESATVNPVAPEFTGTVKYYRIGVAPSKAALVTPPAQE